MANTLNSTDNELVHMMLGSGSNSFSLKQEKEKYKQNVGLRTAFGAMGGPILGGLTHAVNERHDLIPHSRIAKYTIPLSLMLAGAGAYTNNRKSRLTNAFVDKYKGRDKVTKRDLIDAVLNKKAGLYEAVCKMAALVPLNYAKGELQQLANLYKHKNNVYKKVVLKCTNREQEIHDLVKAHLNEKPNNFFTEHGLPTPKVDAKGNVASRSPNKKTKFNWDYYEHTPEEHTQRKREQESAMKDFKRNAGIFSGLVGLDAALDAYGFHKTEEKLKQKFPKVKV